MFLVVLYPKMVKLWEISDFCMSVRAKLFATFFIECLSIRRGGTYWVDSLLLNCIHKLGFRPVFCEFVFSGRNFVYLLVGKWYINKYTILHMRVVEMWIVEMFYRYFRSLPSGITISSHINSSMNQMFKINF